MEEITPIVSIQCLCFNHEAYIRECLEGIVTQQTNFRFEAIVHDDASTDRSVSIIQEYATKYPDIIKPILQKENQYSKGGDVLFKCIAPYFKGKYYAICEGDDYWTDTSKLQRQVDFMEANPDYSLCFHNALVKHEYDNRPDKVFASIDNRDYTGPEIHKNWIIPTASVLIRSDVIKSKRYADVISNKRFTYGDLPLFLTCYEFGKFRGFSDTMSVYRRHLGSIMHNGGIHIDYTMAKFQLEISTFFGDQYKREALKKVNYGYISYFIRTSLTKGLNSRYDLLKEALKISPYLSLWNLIKIPYLLIFWKVVRYFRR